MATLINPSTGTQPRASMQSRRSSNAPRPSEQVDVRNSSHFTGPRSGSHPTSLYLAGNQQRDERGQPIGGAHTRNPSSGLASAAPVVFNEEPSDSDAGHKKLEVGDMTRSESGWSDGFTDEERARLDKRVLRKTDIAMLPLMGVIVMLQFLDKAILSYAALLGLVTDLKLVSNEYSWAASVYYFGLLAGLLLWSVVLQKVTTDLVIGTAVTTWGIVCMCHAATHNYSQILAVRFLLGFFESAITPSFILTVGQFYTERETVSRTAIWYSFNGVAIILGGGMSYGLFTKPPTSNLAIWRELYLILGGITIFVGIWTLMLMPSSPAKTRLFTPDERKVAVTRVTTKPGHSARKMFSPKVWTQFLEAFTDPRLYVMFFGLTLGSIPNGGVTAYSTQLLAGFGFPIGKTLLLTMAAGGAQIVSVLLFIGTSFVSRSRAIGGFILLTVAIAGSAVMFVPTATPAAHTVGYTLLNMGSPAVVALYSFNSAAVGGHGKRVAFGCVAQAAYGAGSIIGPLTFLAEEIPVYRTAKIIIVASLCGAAVSLLLIFGIHTLWNRNRNAAGYPTREELEAEGRFDEDDETDFKDPSYRYVL